MSQLVEGRSPSGLVFPQEAHVGLPSSELLVAARPYFAELGAHAGLQAFKYIEGEHFLHEAYHLMTPGTEITDLLKAPTDGVASKILKNGYANSGFYILVVGSEGKKEIHYVGVAAPMADGEYNIGNPNQLWIINDSVEQTTRISRLQDGAATVQAITHPNGMMPTPDNVDYMMKLIGPPQANGIMSLNQPHEKNLRDLIKKLGIKPHELTQLTLNDAKRPMNTPFVNAAREVGVNLELVDSGDLMPGIAASVNDGENGKGYVVVATRGGVEEGTIAALAARIRGGFMEARFWDKDPAIFESNKILTVDDLAPERSEMAMVTVAGITGDKWLNIPKVMNYGKGEHVVATWTLSRDKIKEDKYSFII